MAVRILISGIFIATVMILQATKNILGAQPSEYKGTIFTLFILFQLFNAFNCVETGSDSIFSNITGNKIMVLTFAATFLIQIIIVTALYPISLVCWIKIILTSLSIVLISEIYKAVYRVIKTEKKKN